MGNDNRKKYDELKEFDGQVYTGMEVGGHHDWNYPDGEWNETKVAPDRWTFTFTSNKGRMRSAPKGSGADVGSKFHWFIVADQKAVKTDENTYKTVMSGVKFKVGHARPNWKAWSYDYNKECYEDIVIEFLKRMITELEEKKKNRGLDKFVGGVKPDGQE